MTETFGITILDAFLLDHAATGFSVEAQAQKGRVLVIDVPASYVQGYLAAIRVPGSPTS